MTLDNGKSVIHQKILKRSAIILYLAFLVISLAAGIIKFPLWECQNPSGCYDHSLVPYSDTYQSSSSTSIFTSPTKDLLIFRYFSTGIVEGKKEFGGN